MGIPDHSKVGWFRGYQAHRYSRRAALWEGWDSLQTTVAGYIAAKELMADGLIEI